MAKNKAEGAVKAELSAQSVYRIDGEVTAVDDSGVTIMARVAGRRVTVPTRFPFSALVAYTEVGAGFVIVNGVQTFDPIAGTVESASAEELVINDVSGQVIHFNLQNKVTPNFVTVDSEDRSLGRSAISTKVLRATEKAAEKPKKSSRKEKASSGSAKKKSGKRR